MKKWVSGLKLTNGVASYLVPSLRHQVLRHGADCFEVATL